VVEELPLNFFFSLEFAFLNHAGGLVLILYEEDRKALVGEWDILMEAIELKASTIDKFEYHLFFSRKQSKILLIVAKINLSLGIVVIKKI
jgi:hypothetical protein